MPTENGEGAPNPDKNRGEIDRIKGLIKADNLIFRGHDYDNPGENELDGKERELIKSFGLEKVETVQQLFDSINDPNRGHEVPKEKLDILATAFYESIVGSGRKEILVAGSSSIEKQLSWAGFSGRDKSNEENPSFAFMVAEKFRSNFGTEEKRNEITTTMEYLDFVKNSEYGKNGGLEEAADQAYDNLKKIKPNVLNKKEMGAYAEALKYISGLRGVEATKSGQKVEIGNQGRVVNGEVVPDAVYAEWLEQLRVAKAEAEANGDKENYKTPIWLMSMKDIVDEEMQQRGKQQFNLSPPYPHWFKELTRERQDLWRVRCKLINGVAWKQMIRNKDLEKLISNEAIDINRAELKLLYEMPHFKEALKTYFDDLFEMEANSPEGPNMLRIKRLHGKADTSPISPGIMGEPLDPSVEEKIVHFQKYKEIMALRMQYPQKSPQECSDLYEKYYVTSNKDGEARKLLASDEYRAGVAAAWTFLYTGNTMESADVDRQLLPSEPVSDKIRTVLHPLQKALGKWGIYKEGKKIEEDKDKPKYKVLTGEEEPVSGPIMSWVTYQLEMDEIKGVNYEDSFRKKMFDRKPGYRPLPPRMATSLIEMLTVPVVKDGKLIYDRIPMSEAIMKGMNITFDVVMCKDGIRRTKSEALREGHEIISHEYEGHDYDICVGFRDTMDGAAIAFNYLTGKAKMEKNAKEWATTFQKDIDLVRQYGTKYYGTKNKEGEEITSPLKFVDNPEFIAWVIASSVGFDQRSEQIVLDFGGSINSNRDGYYNTVREIVGLPGLTKLGVDKNKIMSYLSADGSHNKTYWKLGKIEGEISKNEKLRRKDSKKRRSNDDQW